MEKGNENPFSGLQQTIRGIADELSGTLGIAVRTLNGEASFYYNEHTSFPAASTIKIHILIELFKQVRAGKRKLDDFIEIPITDRVGPLWSQMSSGVLKDLESVTRISLKDAATLMMIVSDNVAANLLIDLLGLENIEDTIRNLGLAKTKLQRKFMDLESAEKGLQNLSSPYEMMATLEKIAGVDILDAQSCQLILDILAKTQDQLGVRRLIPQEIRIEHKTGEFFHVCNDVGIVHLPCKPFIVCVMTKGVNLVKGWDAVAEVGKISYDSLSTSQRKKRKISM